MDSLAKLGFKKGIIFEGIVTTSSRYKPNAAPMGIVTGDMKHIIIRPYKTTRTYKNLTVANNAVINFTDDPYLFYKTALKGDMSEETIRKSIFEKTATSEAPKLKGADAYIYISMIKKEDEEQDRAKLTFKVNRVELINPHFRPYCRGPSAVIEAIIHSTRIRHFLSKDMKDEADRLIKMVEHYHGLVERLAPNSEYTRIMSKTLSTIKSL